MSLIRRKGSSEDEWKKKLTPDQYKILRQKGTEPPFTGKLLHNKEKGAYLCAGYGHELFSSEAKFDSGSGWPSFDTPLAKESVETSTDTSLGMRRIEVHCPAVRRPSRSCL